MPHVITPSKVLNQLKQHNIGQANGIHVKALVSKVLQQPSSAADERHVRHAVAVLRQQGEPICATPAHGYFYADCANDVDETCEFLYSRAMHSLTQISHLKKKSVPDLRGQLGMPLKKQPTDN